MNALTQILNRWKANPDEFVPFLIYSGWAITLLYFPSGFLHFYLEGAVYVRDLLLAAHLAACLWWLSHAGGLYRVLRYAAMLSLTPLMLIPAVINHDYRFEALRTVKWSLFWFDWMIIGYLVCRNRHWDQWLYIFAAITGLELILEWIVGFYEWRVDHYVFTSPTTWNQMTIFGVQEVKELTLKGAIRVRGLQRDVFSFANLMAMSSVVGFAASSVSRKPALKTLGFIWGAMFAIMLVVSGGRSALFGIFAAVLLAVAFSINRHIARTWSKVYVCFWVAVGLMVSVVGVGKFTEMVGGAAFGQHIGDSASAYMRDDFWEEMINDFQNTPIILVVGGPIASLLDSSIAPMFHWADNQYLWNTYHLGLAGALGSAFFFINILRAPRQEGSRRGVDCMVFFLLLVVGEAIARESLTFLGCLPLFVSCGYVVGQINLPTEKLPSGSRRRRRRASASA